VSVPTEPARPEPAQRYFDRVRAGLAGQLLGLERRMYLVIVAPYLLVPAVVLVVRWTDPQRGSGPAEVAVDLAVLVVASAVCLAAPYGLVTRNWGVFSYAYRSNSNEMTEIDWAHPRWQNTASVLWHLGTDPARFRAVSVFTPYANLATIHIPRTRAGFWRAWSD
jgi:hypothetical protein